MLSSLITAGIDNVIDSVGGAIDKIFTSDEERLKAKNELVKIRQIEHIKAIKSADQYEAEISKRWLSDNEHFITRLVRPLIVVFVFVLFGAVVLSDGNIGEFKIRADYIPLLQNILSVLTVAYFGSRGVEKSIKYYKGGK